MKQKNSENLQHYRVSGMSCAACSARVEKAVSAVEGVESCSVSLLTNSMGVTGTASPDAVIQAVERAGYGAERSGQTEKEKPSDDLRDTETPKLLRRLGWSLGFLLALMYVSMGRRMWHFPLPEKLAQNPVALGLLQLLLAAIVLVINQKFFVSGAKAVLHRAPNMDTLVSLGSAAAFGWSVWVLFAMTNAQAGGDLLRAQELTGQLWFESSAMILTLITVGKTLEARAKGKTTSALKSLLRLSPKTATVIRDGNELTLPVEQVRVGDLFAVRPGEHIPVDGVVEEGSSAVDESAMTGESIPVDKLAGSSVSAGTVNRSGYLKCRATRVGEDTALAQIIETVRDAAATKAPIAKAADRVAGIFVPTVLVIAAITTVVWLIVGRGEVAIALERGVSVLVISCPCALGLATPVAILVGSGVGAKKGILYKTAASLEEAGRVEIVALDKTGTVTMGKPEVTDLLPADGVTTEELLRLACALERKSEHPLAKAVLSYAETKKVQPIEVESFRALPGNGLEAEIDGKRLIGGNFAFVSAEADVPETLQKSAEAWAKDGKTPLYFARDGKALGVIAVADRIKPESQKAIEQLKNMGLSVILLTGDNEKTARAIGKEVGVDDVIAGVLPDEKERVIRELSQKGKVAMVGDGINDAPALTRADLGIAIGAGTDIAIDAADVVLMRSTLTDVPKALRLGRATLRNVHENLFWAFFYNGVGIPLAAGVFAGLGIFISPMLGAAAMSLSSFCVVTNALRLNLLAREKQDQPNQIQTKGANQMKKTIKIEGMMCPHCEAAVKKALEAIDGVEEATPNHQTASAELTLSKEVSDETLSQAIQAAGYEMK